MSSPKLLGRLLRELDALLEQRLVGLAAVVDAENHAVAAALGDQFADRGGGLLVVAHVGRRQHELGLGLAGDVHGEPAEWAELGVDADLEPELADVEVDGLVVVEYIDE